MGENQQTFGQWLGEIQANGGLLVLGIIVVILGIVFWLYSARTVKSLREEIAESIQQAKDRLFNHQLHWHLGDGEAIRLDMQEMIARFKEKSPDARKQPNSDLYTGEERRAQ